MNITANHFSQMKLSLGRIVGYGIGDFGFNLFYTGLNLYLLFYYTDVLGIDPATAGVIFMLPVIWDAVTDPIMGAIASRTRTRWGAYRPYILFGGPVMALSFVAMFAAPVIFSGAVVAASLVSHLVFRTCYTVVSVPYTSMSAAMTRDSAERSTIAGTRMVFAIGGGILTAFLTMSLAKSLGDGDLEAGFVQVAILYAFIGTALMLVVFRATDKSDAATTGEALATRHLPLAQSIHFLRGNAAFWILFAAVFVGAVGASVGSKALVYYVGYVVGAPDQVPLLLSASLLITALTIPVWAWAGARFSKRDVWFCGALGLSASQGVLLLVMPQQVSLLLPLNCLAAAFNGAFVTMFWAMLPDTVEFGQWRTGIRDEGIVFGLNQLALKAASGLGVGALGLGLSFIGYVANQPQASEAKEGLGLLTFGIPFLSALLTAFIVRQSPLTKHRHGVLVRWLARS